MLRLALPILALAILGSGCLLPARFGASVHVGSPGYLVEVRPGLWVVENSSRAIFFADGYYWYPNAGVWYRSATYDGDWVRVQVNAVPARITVVDPARYRYYVVRDAPRREIRAEAPGRGPPDVPPGHRARGHDDDHDDDHGKRGRDKDHPDHGKRGRGRGPG